jgi:MFS family permease
LIAGSTTGPIADRWGFPTMYAALSLLGIVWAVMGLLLQDKTVARTRDGGVSTGGRRPGLGGGFYRLLLAGLAVGTAACVAFLGRLLAMDELGFGAAAISGTGAIGAAVTLPLPALVGRLSDRVGRVPLLVAGYLVGTIALLGFAMSTSLWHFWLATALIGLMGCVGSVGSALVADLVPREALGQSLSLFGTSTMVAGIIASAGTGLAFQHLGTVSTFVGGAVLPLLAIGLLIPLRRTAREEPVAAAGLASATA